jgi:uncharacterized protein
VRGLVGGSRTPAEEVALTAADGVELAASLLPGPPGAPAAVVLAHGFAAHREKPAYARLADGLTVRFAVLSIDLRGHGDSDGACTFGDHEARDVAAAVAALRRRGHERVAAVGVSMGATALLHALAVAEEDVDAAVVVSAPSRLGRTDTTPLARLDRIWRTPWRRRAFEVVAGIRLVPPETWGPMDNPVELVASVDVPLLVVHGVDDHLFPVDDGRALVAASAGPAALWEEPAGFGHAEDGLTRRFARRLGRAIEVALASGGFPDRAELVPDRR